MPTSDHSYISDVIGRMRELKPESVLDIGVGFGKWGNLAREYLDIMEGRVYPKDWTTTIDGIEVFEPYITDRLRAVYTEIVHDDVLQAVERGIPEYDLIIASDVVEHIPKTQAESLIVKLRRQCKHLFLMIPIGPEWLSQGELYGNSHEAHVSAWSAQDFDRYEPEYRSYLCNGKRIDWMVIRGN